MSNVDSVAAYNILPVCAGYGGLDLGLKIAIRNLRAVAYVEREAQACAGLAARMQDGTLDAAPIWSDLSTFDGRRFNGLVDCVVSSDPCQPNSVAGSRLGSADDRFLIDQLIRVIDEVRPSRVFRENVTGNADGQLAALIPALEAMGYSVTAGIFSASEVGASHRRERLFIMADAESKRYGFGRKRELADSQGIVNGSLSERAIEEHARPSVSRGNLANTYSIDRRRGQRPKEQKGIGAGERLKDNGRKLSHATSSRQRRESNQEQPSEQFNQGLRRLPYFAPGPNDPRWETIIRQAPSLKPALCSMADGVANRTDELRAAGNGVCSMAGAIAWLSLSAHFEEGLKDNDHN